MPACVQLPIQRVSKKATCRLHSGPCSRRHRHRLHRSCLVLRLTATGWAWAATFRGQGGPRTADGKASSGQRNRRRATVPMPISIEAQPRRISSPTCLGKQVRAVLQSIGWISWGHGSTVWIAWLRWENRAGRSEQGYGWGWGPTEPELVTMSYSTCRREAATNTPTQGVTTEVHCTTLQSIQTRIQQQVANGIASEKTNQNSLSGDRVEKNCLSSPAMPSRTKLNTTRQRKQGYQRRLSPFPTCAV